MNESLTSDRVENLSIFSECMSDQYEADTAAEICSFWFEGILLLVVGLFGIIGNVISIFILSKLQAHNFFDSLLIALTTIDIIFIIFTIVDYSLAREFSWPWPEDSLVWVYLIPKFTYPLNNMCFCSSVFLTVLIAGERYLAVCHPITYRDMSVSKSRKQRLVLYLLPVIVVSAVLNIPKFFETIIINRPVVTGTRLIYNLNGTNVSLTSPTEVQYQTTVQLSQLRSNPLYTKYYTFLTRLVVTGIIPITALLFFNFNIYLGLKASRARTTIRPGNLNQDRRRAAKTTTETSLSLILLFIVAVFLCCHFPRLILNMAEFVNVGTSIDSCGGTVESSPWFQCLTGFSHLLLMLNGSVNFLIYCSLNNSFKAALRSSVKGCFGNIFGGCINPNKDTVTAEIQLDGMITNGGPGGETVTTLLQ